MDSDSHRTGIVARYDFGVVLGREFKLLREPLSQTLYHTTTPDTG